MGDDGNPLLRDESESSLLLEQFDAVAERDVLFRDTILDIMNEGWENWSLKTARLFSDSPL